MLHFALQKGQVTDDVRWIFPFKCYTHQNLVSLTRRLTHLPDTVQVHERPLAISAIVMLLNFMPHDVLLRDSAEKTDGTLWCILSPVLLQVHVFAAIIFIVKAIAARVAFKSGQRVTCCLTVLIAGCPACEEELVTVATVVSHVDMFES